MTEMELRLDECRVQAANRQKGEIQDRAEKS